VDTYHRNTGNIVTEVKIIIVGIPVIFVILVKIITMETAVHVANTEITQP
jgi:hypothetical protein